MSRAISRREFIAAGIGVTASGLALLANPYAAKADEASADVQSAVSAGHWLHLAASQSKVVDDQFLGIALKHYDGITLNTTLNGVEPRYDYAALIDRTKMMKSDAKVLLYTMGLQYTPTGRIAGNVLEGYEDLGDLLMPEWSQPIGKSYFGDPRNSEFRDWLVERIGSWVEDLGADGVFVDVTRMIPTYYAPLSDDAVTAYRLGTAILFDEIRGRIGSNRIAVYNGLWGTEYGGIIREGWLEIQLELMDHSSGAFVEYFGLRPNVKRSVDVRQYLPIPTDYPDKILMFAGRAAWTYEDYADDLRRQRYDYVAFLLLADGMSYFEYSATFQEPGTYSPARGEQPGSERTGALAPHSDWAVDLGQPTGLFEEVNGLFGREFEQGLVILNPAPSSDSEIPQTKTFTLDHTMFDPEGNDYTGQVSVDPFVGLILLNRRLPLDRHTSCIGWDDPDAPGGDWSWASISQGVLHLDPTPVGQEWEHDLLLDPVRSLSSATKLDILVRTADSAAALVIEVEVDDSSRELTHAMVEVSGEAVPLGTPPQSVAGVPFRASTPALWDSFGANVALVADNEWRHVQVDAAAILGASGRYVARRLCHARLLGAMDIRELWLFQ